jgi:hypothetical protein
MRQPPEIEEREPQQRTRKKTRRWCRGKVGVEHQVVRRPRDPRATWSRRTCGWWTLKTDGLWICIEQDVCTECGKILRDGLVNDCTVKAGMEEQEQAS